MQLFIHRQNILFFQKQLAEETIASRRVLLLRLLAEEEAKGNGGASAPVPPDALAVPA